MVREQFSFPLRDVLKCIGSLLMRRDVHVGQKQLLAANEGMRVADISLPFAQ